MKLKYLALYLLFFFSGEIADAQTYKIWGTASSGGSKGYGVVFQLNRDGTGYRIMHNFDRKAGEKPRELIKVIKGPASTLYGLTKYGGQYSSGVLYSINISNNAYTVLHHFTAAEGTPTSLFLASNGKIYGTALGGTSSNGRLFTLNPANNAFTVVFQFGGVATGASPGKLMQASNGLLYGMTHYGGAFDVGVIYSFNTVNNVFSKLYDFVRHQNDFGCDICHPAYSAFAQNTDGLLYAFAQKYDPANTSPSELISFNTVNNAVTLISFFNSATGRNPSGPLLRPTPGNFYGLASEGGTNNKGTLYLFNTWVGYPLAQINFNGIGNGSEPIGSLMSSADTKFYGVTSTGGSFGYGTIFNYSAANNILTKIHDFPGTDGSYPYGNLVEIATGKIVAKDAITMNAETEPVTTLVNIFPNPVLQGQAIKIKFNSVTAARYTITLTDARGNQLLMKSVELVQGVNLLKVDVGNLLKGVYIIVIKNDRAKNTSKLIVQ